MQTTPTVPWTRKLLGLVILILGVLLAAGAASAIPDVIYGILRLQTAAAAIVAFLLIWGGSGIYLGVKPKLWKVLVGFLILTALSYAGFVIFSKLAVA